jgi:hypothetical protein
LIRLKKIRLSDFNRVRVELRKEATLENLKIQVCLKHEKWDRSIKESKQKKLELEVEAAKTGSFDF